jgi:hypothetical protein
VVQVPGQMVDTADLVVRLANGCKATPSQLPRILSKQQCQVQQFVTLPCLSPLKDKLESLSHTNRHLSRSQNQVSKNITRVRERNNKTRFSCFAELENDVVMAGQVP